MEEIMADEKVITKPTEVKPVVPKVDPKLAPKPFVNVIPDGAMDPENVTPGFGPLQGSPKENDPTELANPNNPNSPVTVPSNPSNPANMPQTQSDKPPSEQRKYMAELGVLNTPVIDPNKANRDKRKAELTKQIADVMKEYNNTESSIPSSHPYWGVINELRVLNNP
jgi:hypothetical protein